MCLPISTAHLGSCAFESTDLFYASGCFGAQSHVLLQTKLYKMGVGDEMKYLRTGPGTNALLSAFLNEPLSHCSLQAHQLFPQFLLMTRWPAYPYVKKLA